MESALPTPRVQVVRIEADIVWEAQRNPATGRWIGVCRELNLNATGDTWSELQEAANEAMTLLFMDLFQEGELAAFLKRNGWRTADEVPKAPVLPRFDVPADWRHNARYEELVAARA